jgi:predicted RND superfamily exporter protein
MKNTNTHSSASFGSRSLDAYINFAVDRPWIIFSLMLVITGFFGFKLTELKVDSTPYFMDGDHPERREEAVVRSQFTSTKEQAFVLVVAQGQDIYNHETLTTIDQLSRAFESL